LDRGIDALGKGATVALAAGALASDGPILGDVAPHHEIDDLAALRDFLRRDGRQVAPGWSFCPPGFLPLDWRNERGGGFLNCGSEEGGLLELWLSLAKRASNSWMRCRSCSICAACSTARTRQLGVWAFGRVGCGRLIEHGAKLHA
jgi:hypothetical protein